jgi:hypothetical protein
MPRNDAKDEGDAMWNVPHDSEPGCCEPSELARLARLESKSNSMADDVLVTWDAAKRRKRDRLRRRRWVGRALGVTFFVATAVLLAASVASIARAPIEDADDRRLDQLAAPWRRGPFLP